MAVLNKRLPKKLKSKKKSNASHNITRELEINFDWNIKKEDLYAVLGIKKYEINCTCDEIKASYKKMQALCHPDKYNDETKKKAGTRAI